MTLLQRFESSLQPEENQVLDDVSEYVAWMIGRQQSEFVPTNDDEIDLRAYLLHLRVDGVLRKDMRHRLNSLRRFYHWVKDEGLIEYDPFTTEEFNRPLLDREEIRRRRQIAPEEVQERELTHLRALHKLTQQLNRSVDVRTALETALETLASAMNLQTAWMYVVPDIYYQFTAVTERLPHDFAVAATYGLPPGLQRDNPCYLCQAPDCHCQELARTGRLQRAVNVVECTRLQDSARADGDNRGLFFHASTPLIASDRLLGLINVATDEWQFFTSDDLQFLSMVGSQIAVTLEWAYLYDMARVQRERLEQELNMAREVQASLLPRDMPLIPGFELAASWHSAREVAGDFYDVFPLPEGRWGLVIGDVSDKGAPAALYMTMVRSLIRATAGITTSPAETLLIVNKTIQEHSTSDMFVTVFYAVLNHDACSLVFASAGHDPPLLRRLSGSIERLQRTGPILGVFEEMTLADRQVDLAPGDLLLGYTDGVTDALNAEGEEYGAARLARVVGDAPTAAWACLAEVEADLTSFMDEKAQTDDITLLVLGVDHQEDLESS